MKLFYITILLFVSTYMFAKPINKNTAQTIAVNFMKNAYPNKSDYSIKSVVENKIKEIHTTYVIQFNSGGYVMVSANDATIPVFVFSENGHYNENDISPATHLWYQYYNQTVYQTAIDNIPNTKTRYKWDMIIENIKDTKVVDTIVAPLIQTKWGQSVTNDSKCPGYNYRIQESSNCADDCGNCTAGCGAVAMAQIMRYWAHPYICFDDYFDWCNMPDSLFKFIYGTNEIRPEYVIERDEISTLMYLCGKYTNMDYCVLWTCSSFNLPTYMLTAFENEFKYDESANLRRRFYYSDEQWKNHIKTDLNNEQPILYAGVQELNKGKTTHAFICDGYGTQYGDDYFHFNFGWRGSGDDFYHIDTIQPDNDGPFYMQRAIFEIKPDEDLIYDNCDESLTVLQSHKTIYPPFFYYPAFGEIYSSPYPILIDNGDNVTYTANNNIRLKNFRINSGGTFKAQLIDCPSDCRHAGKTVQENPDKTVTGTNDDMCIEESKVLLYPNPANQSVTLEIKIPESRECICIITNISGMSFYNENFNVSKGYFTKEIDLSAIPPGIYFVNIKNNNLFETKKLIISK